ncbi:twin-arginine translocation signal domain-containing protein, partial [Nocardia puris]|uniref:twin-arginine translocation signal domain-containing protein n=1 Tax=Nocardia puris TaxID=208602 RepID=UPI001893A9B2|nr:twin-arginine translocation signal domain-containing protein [Nocardia puris]
MKDKAITSALSRRGFIKQTAAIGGAAMLGGLWSGAALSAGSGAPETRSAKLGFIALT